MTRHRPETPGDPDTDFFGADFEVGALERAIGIPSWEWPGRCFDVARALLRESVIDGHAAYGLWTGPVVPSAFFDGKAAQVRHGWIVTSEGRIVDPTRFVFERTAPYIYCGPNDFYANGQAIDWQVTAPTRRAKTPGQSRNQRAVKRRVRVHQRVRDARPE